MQRVGNPRVGMGMTKPRESVVDLWPHFPILANFNNAHTAIDLHPKTSASRQFRDWQIQSSELAEIMLPGGVVNAGRIHLPPEATESSGLSVYLNLHLPATLTGSIQPLEARYTSLLNGVGRVLPRCGSPQIIAGVVQAVVILMIYLYLRLGIKNQPMHIKMGASFRSPCPTSVPLGVPFDSACGLTYDTRGMPFVSVNLLEILVVHQSDLPLCKRNLLHSAPSLLVTLNDTPSRCSSINCRSSPVSATCTGALRFNESIVAPVPWLFHKPETFKAGAVTIATVAVIHLVAPGQLDSKAKMSGMLAVANARPVKAFGAGDAFLDATLGDAEEFGDLAARHIVRARHAAGRFDHALMIRKLRGVAPLDLRDDRTEPRHHAAQLDDERVFAVGGMGLHLMPPPLPPGAPADSLAGLPSRRYGGSSRRGDATPCDPASAAIRAVRAPQARKSRRLLRAIRGLAPIGVARGHAAPGGLCWRGYVCRCRKPRSRKRRGPPSPSQYDGRACRSRTASRIRHSPARPHSARGARASSQARCAAGHRRSSGFSRLLCVASLVTSKKICSSARSAVDWRRPARARTARGWPGARRASDAGACRESWRGRACRSRRNGGIGGVKRGRSCCVCLPSFSAFSPRALIGDVLLE